MNDKLQAAIKAAREAIDAGDLEAAKSHRADAERIRDLMAEASSLEDVSKSYAPTRPTLPAAGEGNVPQVADTPATKAAPAADAANDHLSSTQKAAYVTRFGENHQVVKSILHDLHGNDYETLYWAQKSAFNRYVRAGENAINNDDRKLLRGVVMNPQMVKMALDQGVDDFKVLKAMMVEASDTLGGYLVPVDFQNRIIEQVAQLTTMRAAASKMTTSRDRVEIPEATGGDGRYTSPVRTSWVDETPVIGQLPSNYVTFGLRGINIHTAMSEAALSRNFLDDIAFDIEGYLATKLSESVALDEDQQFLVGDGVGKPRGILPSLANVHNIREVNTGSASDITWDGLISLTYSIPAQYRQAGQFLANKDTYRRIAQLKDSGGGYLWQAYQFDGGQAGRVQTLLGYGIQENELMPDVGAGAIPILFGDYSSYQIVDRLGMSVERFIGAQEARQNLVYFVMRRRLGGDMVETWKLSAHRVAA